MQKAYATTVITSMEEPRSLGIAPTINYMQPGCAKIAISTITIGKRD